MTNYVQVQQYPSPSPHGFALSQVKPKSKLEKKVETTWLLSVTFWKNDSTFSKWGPSCGHEDGSTGEPFWLHFFSFSAHMSLSQIQTRTWTCTSLILTRVRFGNTNKENMK